MKLIRALHKSEHRAAILSLSHHYWSEVVVEWGYHQYTTETHQYGKDGILQFQIINYTHVNEVQLRLTLGDEYYFSDAWEPYKTPTPQELKEKIQTIRSKYRPKKIKEMRTPYTKKDFDAIMKEIWSE